MVIALVFVGPKRLPHVIRYLGRQYGKLMRASEDLRRAFVIEADRMDAEDRTKQLRQRREAARKRAAQAQQAKDDGLPQPQGAPTLPDDAAMRLTPMDKPPKFKDETSEVPPADAVTADAVTADAVTASDVEPSPVPTPADAPNPDDADAVTTQGTS